MPTGVWFQLMSVVRDVLCLMSFSTNYSLYRRLWRRKASNRIRKQMLCSMRWRQFQEKAKFAPHSWVSLLFFPKPHQTFTVHFSQKVEFLQVNGPAQQLIRSRLSHQSTVREQFNHQEKNQPIANIPYQQAANNFPEANENFQSSEQFPRPRTVCSKMRNMFSFMRKPRSNSNRKDNDDVEQALDDDNAEFYYFDHGSPGFYRTTDCPPHLISEIIAQRTTNLATKFWAEFFASLNIGVTFIITFFMQFYR